MTQLMCVSISDLRIKVHSQGAPYKHKQRWPGRRPLVYVSIVSTAQTFSVYHKAHISTIFLLSDTEHYIMRKNIQEIMHISDLCVYTFIEHIAYHGTN